MAWTIAVVLIVPLIAAFSARPQVTAAQGAGGVTLQPVFGGLSSPVLVTHAPDNGQRLFVVERQGRIRVAVNGVLQGTPFLDVTSVVNDSGFEMGLLGLAFHPQYGSNGLFYIYYTASDGENTLARVRRSAGDPLRADSGSLDVLFALDDPYANHNGGMLAFGPDGYLYVGTGDGGSAGDPENRAQNLDSLFGKLLRLDVSTADSGPLYTSPASNPFVNRSGARDEVWALGLRNPWRFSFDRQTGDLWIGDVGQGNWEEIDRLPAGSPGGANFEWRCREGFQPYNGNPPCNQGTPAPPVHAYDHSGGSCSVTGGYVYRGSLAPALQGQYVFGDYCSGRIWTLRQTSPGVWQSTQLLDTGYSISSFGEDAAGELYLTDIVGGTVYRFGGTPSGPTPTPTPSPSGPTATPTATPPAGSQTVTFDGLTTVGEALWGEYPSGVIAWAGDWYLAAPFGQLPTRNISFGEGRTSAGLTLLNQRSLVQLDAYNGGSGQSTVTLACPGQPTKTQSVGAGQLATIATGWTAPCAAVTVGSSNGWDTNFDNLRVTAGGGPVPSATPTRTPTPPPGVTPSRTATPRPQADLLVTEFVAASGPEDKPLPVSITIVNQGQGAAGTFDAHVYADVGPPNPAPRLITPHFELPGLAPGQSVTLTGYIDPGTLTVGQHTLFGQADGHDTVTESTKDNNIRTLTITVSAPATATPTGTVAVPTATRTPTATATSPAGLPDVRFDDRPGQDQTLDGQYPAGVIDWGSGQWYHAAPWGALSSKSVSFAGPDRSSATLTLLGSRRLVSLRAYNGGAGATTVTLACPGQPTKTQGVAPGQTVTIATGWTAPCAAVTVGSSNGWDTNFDDLELEGDGATPPTPPPGASASPTPSRTPTPSPTRTATPSPTRTPTPQTLNFDGLPGQDQALGGQYPQGVIDWGSGKWYLAAPWKGLTSNSVSFNGMSDPNVKSASITFLQPRRLQAVKAYNGGAAPATVTLQCAGQPDRSVTIGPEQSATLTTGWTASCPSVTFSSSNGWETNFDDLVIDGA